VGHYSGGSKADGGEGLGGGSAVLIAKIFIETAYAPPASGKSALGLAAKIEAIFFMK
jgi:hypothetical protein